MDSTRAKQIMQSPDSIQVVYNGYPVWLESVVDNNTVEVTNLESKQKQVVPIDKLIEGSSLR